MRKPETKSKPAPAKASAPVTARPRIPVWLLAGLLVLVTMAVYWPTTRHEFVNYDDNLYVTSNVHVQNGLTLENVKWAFANPVVANWHPLTMMSHMLDCQIYGLKPWGHHLTNVLLHALNAALVFIFLRQLTGAVWRSLLVAALFAVHPLHVESVAWVAERKDVLSSFFGLLSLIFYVRYAQCVTGDKCQVAGPKAISASVLSRATRLPDEALAKAGHSSLSYGLALFFLALGLMSKPMLVTWPFVMLLLDYWPLARFQTRSLWQLVIEKVPFFVLAASASVVTFVVQQHGSAFESAENFPLSARVGNALVSYCRYLGKMFWPTDLAVFYPHPAYWPVAEVLLAGLLLVVISVLFFLQRRPYPFLLMGWFWFVGTLVPVIGLVQVGRQAMADRYTYIPSLGVLIAAIWGEYELTRRWRYPVIVLLVAGWAAILLCSRLTQQQLGYWQDSETLFRHALAVTKNNSLVHLNLGNALDRKGRPDEAIGHYQEAIRLSPGWALAHYNLGTTLNRIGQTDAAISQFQEAIRLKPDYAEAHYNVAIAFDKNGQTDEAITQFQEAVRLKPDYAEAHNNLGIALDKKGQTDEAISQYREAIRMKPDFTDAHYNLAVALNQKGLCDDAISQYKEVIRLKPDYTDAHYNLGVALEKKGQTDEAVSQLQEAIHLKPDYAEAHNNLGAALGRKGQIGEAINQYQEAIRLKSDYADAHYNLGIALGREGRTDEAITQFQEVIHLKPDYAQAYNNLGAALAARGRFDEAIEDYRKAIQINSNRPELFVEFGMILGQLGRTREAVIQFRKALELNPDLAGALNNLAWVLATSPDDQVRNGVEAVRLAEHACELTRYHQPLFIGTLAAAYAECGRFPEAVTTAEKAEQLATDAGQAAVAAKNRQLLELYRAGKPCHEPAPIPQK